MSGIYGHGANLMAARNRRRLGDLYVVGKEVSFDDGTGDPIVVFVRKLNPIEHETALKRANAVRASLLVDYRNPDSEASRELQAELLDYDRDELVHMLVEEERATHRPVIEAEVEAREDWANEGYLDGLIEAWNDGLSDKHVAGPKDPESPEKDEEYQEALKIHGEMERLLEEVDEELDAHIEAYEKDLEELSEDELRKRSEKSRMNMKINSEWFTEFRRCELWLCVKEKDRKTNYFQDRNEIASLPLEVMSRLVSEYKALSMEPAEGKDSRAQDDSSASSE